MVISLSTEIKLYFVNDIKLIASCLHVAILGYISTDNMCFITQNLILLVFKFYVFYPVAARVLVLSSLNL